MTFRELWQRVNLAMPRRTESRPSDDVREELMFHFRELVQEQLASGKSFDAAWDTAQARFGSLARYESDCLLLRLKQRMHWVVPALFIVMCLMLYRLGASIPQPMINQQAIQELNDQLQLLKQREWNSLAKLVPPTETPI